MSQGVSKAGLVQCATWKLVTKGVTGPVVSHREGVYKGWPVTMRDLHIYRSILPDVIYTVNTRSQPSRGTLIILITRLINTLISNTGQVRGNVRGRYDNKEIKKINTNNMKVYRQILKTPNLRKQIKDM